MTTTASPQPVTTKMRVSLVRPMTMTDEGMLQEGLDVLEQVRHNIHAQINTVTWSIINRRTLDLHVTYTVYNGASPEQAARRAKDTCRALLEHSRTSVRVHWRNTAGVEYPA